MTSCSTAESSSGTRLTTDHSSKIQIQQGPVAIERRDCQSIDNRGHLCSLPFIVPRLSPGRPIDSIALSIHAGLEVISNASTQLLRISSFENKRRVRKQAATGEFGARPRNGHREQAELSLALFLFRHQRPAPRHRSPLATKTGDYRATMGSTVKGDYAGCSVSMKSTFWLIRHTGY